MNVLRLITLLALTAIVLSGDAVNADSVCQNDNDCQLFYECKGYEIKKCVHKSLFPNPSARELVGVFLAMVVNALTNAAGVGAGGLIAPFLMLFNNFMPNEAVIVTYPMIFGGGVGTAINFIYRRNPQTKGPLINYSNLLLVVPAFQIGAPIGVLLNRFLSPLVENILLIILLSVVCCGITIKSIGLLCNEKQKGEVQNKNQADQQKVQPNEPKTQAGEQKNQSDPQKNQPDEQKVTQNPHPEPTSSGTKTQITQESNLKLTENIKDLENNQKQETKMAQIETIEIVPEKDGIQSQNKLDSTKCGSTRHSNIEFTHIDLDKMPHSESDHTKTQDIPRKISFEEQKKPQGEIKEAVQKAKYYIRTDSQIKVVNRKIEKLSRKEKRLFPPEKILLLIFILIVLVLFNLFAGTTKVKSIIGVEFCSGGYWGIYATLIGLQALFFWGASHLVLRLRREKASLGWDMTREMIINRKILILLLVFGVLGGLFSGLLAAGGALITWLLLLHLGVPPLPVLATISVLIDFNQFTTVLMSCLEENYVVGDLMFYLCVSAVFSFIATKIIHHLVRTKSRQSYILINLAIILFVSLIINFILLFVELHRNHDYVFHFKSFCA